MIKLLARTLKPGTRFIATTDLAHYKKYGFVVLSKQFSEKKLEPLKYSGRNLLRSISEYTGREIIPEAQSRTALEDDCMFFSGGKLNERAARNVKLTESVRGLIGDGINLLTSYLHKDVEELLQITQSKIVRQIVQEIFGMKAPLIAASLYISIFNKKWRNVRKDNSYIRTTPSSTQVSIIIM